VTEYSTTINPAVKDEEPTAAVESEANFELDAGVEETEAIEYADEPELGTQDNVNEDGDDAEN
jgi:hypothetical protein